MRSFTQVGLHIDENDKLVVILGRLNADGTESIMDHFAIHTDETIDKTAVPFIKNNTLEQATITMIKEPSYELLPGYIGGNRTLDTPCLKGCFPLNDERSKCDTPPHGFRKYEWDYCDLEQPSILKRKEIITKWNTNNPTNKINFEK